MNTVGRDQETPCPSCSALLPTDAVICVQCGLNLKTGCHLATSVDSAPESHSTDSNPYASPSTHAADTPAGSLKSPEFDLDEVGLRRAKAVVSDAQSVFLWILFSWLCCAIAGLIMLPWYSYRLFAWHSLYNQFAELRHPNSFSPNVDIAVKFQDARFRYVAGITSSAILWFFVVVIIVAQQVNNP